MIIFENSQYIQDLINIDIELDATNLTCPLPILKTKKSLLNMNSGEILKVITTDRNSINDFTLFSQKTGNILLRQEEYSGKYIHIIKRK